jgi:hypothetical protein
LIPRTPADVGKFHNLPFREPQTPNRPDEVLGNVVVPLPVYGTNLPISNVRFDGEYRG